MDKEETPPKQFYELPFRQPSLAELYVFFLEILIRGNDLRGQEPSNDRVCVQDL